MQNRINNLRGVDRTIPLYSFLQNQACNESLRYFPANENDLINLVENLIICKPLKMIENE